MNKKSLYGYMCEYCDGTVQEQLVDREVFKYRQSFVILENVPVGICDTCGHRYYHSTLLRQVEEVFRQRDAAQRVELVPVATYVQT